MGGHRIVVLLHVETSTAVRALCDVSFRDVVSRFTPGMPTSGNHEVCVTKEM